MTGEEHSGMLFQWLRQPRSYFVHTVVGWLGEESVSIIKTISQVEDRGGSDCR
jgi:hypothetical protein